jgi:hypothetical protein
LVDGLHRIDTSVSDELSSKVELLLKRIESARTKQDNAPYDLIWDSSLERDYDVIKDCVRKAILASGGEVSLLDLTSDLRLSLFGTSAENVLRLTHAEAT